MRFLFPSAVLVLAISCNAFSDRQQKQYTSPKGYRMDSPVHFRLRESMQEISGLALYPDEQRILAINDEEGKIYQLDATDKSKPYNSWKFAKNGDYEDIVYTGKDWYVLKSNGSLHLVQALFTDSTSSTTYHLHIKGKKEFETVYHDQQQNSLVLICKNCETDKKHGITSAYRFDLAGQTFDTIPVYHFKVKDIAEMAGGEIRFFKPSAAAIHPIEKRLYILASVNGLLVIADTKGNVQEVHHLKRKMFAQPEGIAFAPNGDMYISNEATEESTADILKFTYHAR